MKANKGESFVTEQASPSEKMDPKEKMRIALEKKKRGNSGVTGGPSSGSKVGSGQTGGAAPKMHRRKSGSD